MISYARLWETMKLRGATAYTLQVKGGISGSSIRRLWAGESVTTNTLDARCKFLQCDITDIIQCAPDET